MDPTISTIPAPKPAPTPTPGSAMPLMGTAPAAQPTLALQPTPVAQPFVATPQPAVAAQPVTKPQLEVAPQPVVAQQSTPVATQSAPVMTQSVAQQPAPKLMMTLEEMFAEEPTPMPAEIATTPINEPTPALIAQELGLSDETAPAPSGVTESVGVSTALGPIPTAPTTPAPGSIGSAFSGPAGSPNNVSFTDPAVGNLMGQTSLPAKKPRLGGGKISTTTWVLIGILGMMVIVMLIAILVINMQG